MDGVRHRLVVAGRVVGQEITGKDDERVEPKRALALLPHIQQRSGSVPLHVADEHGVAGPDDDHRPAIDLKPVRVRHRLIEELVVVIPKVNPIGLLTDVEGLAARAAGGVPLPRPGRGVVIEDRQLDGVGRSVL